MPAVALIGPGSKKSVQPVAAVKDAPGFNPVAAAAALSLSDVFGFKYNHEAHEAKKAESVLVVQRLDMLVRSTAARVQGLLAAGPGTQYMDTVVIEQDAKIVDMWSAQLKESTEAVAQFQALLVDATIECAATSTSLFCFLKPVSHGSFDLYRPGTPRVACSTW